MPCRVGPPKWHGSWWRVLTKFGSQEKAMAKHFSFVALRIPWTLSVSQFSHSVVSDSLQSHGLPHARLPCPLPTPGACSNSCPSSQWCYPIISSFVVPFSSCLQSWPASGSFSMSQFSQSSGQNIVVSASASDEHYEKAKRYDTEKWTRHVGGYSICY